MEAYEGTGKEPKIETSDNAFKMIALAKEQDTFTRKDVEKALGIGQTTCGRLLRQMIENGQLVQEGRSKNTHYRLSK